MNDDPVPPPVLGYRTGRSAPTPARWWLRFAGQAVVGLVLGVGVSIGLMAGLAGYHDQFADYDWQNFDGRKRLSLAELLIARGSVVAVLGVLIGGAVLLWRRQTWRGLLPGILIGIGLFLLPLGACFVDVGN